jgi:predicted DNA-binding protein (MmcQ/YjbR family)
MLFQFFVNKCTHKIDTLYNTQQKKNTYTVDNFFGVIISKRQQQIIKNKTKKKQKKHKKHANKLQPSYHL